MSSFIVEGENYPLATFLLICDRSASMGKAPRNAKSPIEQLNEGLPDLVGELKLSRKAKERAALSVISFAEDVTPAPIRRIQDIPDRFETLRAGGKTDFARPLQEARHLLERDVPTLSQHLYRPVVFFLSDGNHNIGNASRWMDARERLTAADFPLRPTIVSFAIGQQADTDALRQIASDDDRLSLRWGEHTGEAIEAVIDIVLETTLRFTEGKVREDGEEEKSLAEVIQDHRDPGDDRDEIIWTPRQR